MPDIENGKFIIYWSKEDQEWVATHDEYFSLSWLEDTPQAALMGMLSLIQDLHDEAEAEAGNA